MESLLDLLADGVLAWLQEGLQNGQHHLAVPVLHAAHVEAVVGRGLIYYLLLVETRHLGQGPVHQQLDQSGAPYLRHVLLQEGHSAAL